MCEPTTAMFAVSSALAVGSAAMGVKAQQDQANAIGWSNYQKSVQANRQFAFDQMALQEQERQDVEKAVQDKWDNQKSAAKALATARVAAGEAGVSGLSVDSLMSDYHRQAGDYNQRVDQNVENRQFERNLQSTASGLRAGDAYAAMQSVPTPNYLGATLQAGSGIFGAYKDFLYVPTPKAPTVAPKTS